MKKVLLIDDNADHRMIYRHLLEHAGYAVIEAATGADAVERTVSEAPDCVIVDYFIGSENGFALLHQMLRDIPRCPPVIFLTCALTEPLRRNAMALGAVACFDKATLDADELLGAIKVAC